MPVEARNTLAEDFGDVRALVQIGGEFVQLRTERIVPVNPAQAGKRPILRRRVYADLVEAAASHPNRIEIVDVFRPSHEASGIARQAIEIGAKVLWLQLGVVSEEAARMAREAGLAVVMDRCCKIEHARFFGGLRTIGLNTGVVTSRLAMRLPQA